MVVSDFEKKLILGNETIHKYIVENNLSQEKLEKCELLSVCNTIRVLHGIENPTIDHKGSLLVLNICNNEDGTIGIEETEHTDEIREKTGGK